MPVSSFDVFDTVVTRTFAAPRDLFVFLGQELRRRGFFAGEPEQFARARWRSELQARKKSQRARGVEEVTLPAIYVELAKRLHWDQNQSATAQEMELALEAAHLRPVPRLTAALARARIAAGGSLWFLSDMYLPAATLHGWLQRLGVAQAGDRVWVSGEAGANKSSKQLFEKIRAETDVDFAAWTHVGDHPAADCAAPKALGIEARPAQAAQLTPAEKFIRGGGEFAPPWRSLLAGAMRRARLEAEPGDEREDGLRAAGADVAGPLFFAFVRWCLAEAERRGKKRIYFLARDGQVLHRLAELIPSPVESRYLLASRLAFSGLRELTDEEARRQLLAPSGRTHTLRQTLAHAGLSEAWAEAHLLPRWREADWNRPLPPDDRLELAAWLEQEPQRQAVVAALQKRTELARGYLAQEGVAADALLVDLGWAGSLQLRVEALLAMPVDFAYLALMPGCAGRVRGAMLDFAAGAWPMAEQRPNSLCVLLELLAMADHASLAGFQQEGGRIIPVFQNSAAENSGPAAFLQAAILGFARCYREVEELAAPDREVLRRLVLALASRLHDRPTEMEARTLGSLPHADQWLETRRHTLCAPLDAAAAWRALAWPRQRLPYWWLEGQAALTPTAAPALRAYAALRRFKWRAAARAHAPGR